MFKIIEQGSSSGGVKYPPFAMMLRAELDNEWDWIIASVADEDLKRYKWIRQNCTYFEIAKMYAMQTHNASATAK